MADRSAVTELAGPVIVDASVAVEYLVAFSMTRQAQALFRTSVDGDVELWAPDLLYPESVSALRRLVRVRAVRLKPPRPPFAIWCGSRSPSPERAGSRNKLGSCET
jgi:hypothetical protein